MADLWVCPLHPRPGRRLEHWWPDDGGPLAGPSEPGLGSALLAVGAAPIDDRYPVVAFGSNASPAQLLDKFRVLDPAQRVIPVTRGSIRGLALGHSPHVSNPGYVPYVVVDGGGATVLDVFVLWLDATQLGCLNETEPNYRLAPVPGDSYPLTLESAQPVAAYSAYKGRWGALQWPGERRPAGAGTQEVVLTALGRFAWFRALVGGVEVRSVVARLREDRALRDRVRRELADRGLGTSDGWTAVSGSSPDGR